jgi:hypothetical protein
MPVMASLLKTQKGALVDSPSIGAAIFEVAASKEFRFLRADLPINLFV